MDLAALLKNRVLIGDGAMGTELIRYGVPPNSPMELVNLENPQLVAKVHRGYAEAGSDLVLTNSFGATSVKLNKFGLAKRMREINLAAVHIAREAVPGTVLIGGDIGPTGELLKPYGLAEPVAVKAAYLEQAAALAEARVDFLILETFYDLTEALLALGAARETGLPVIVSMTFELKRASAYTVMGHEATDCARILTDAGAAAVGANCTVSIDGMPEIAKLLKKGTNLPLILQPNAGQPEMIAGRVFYRETPEHFASLAAELVSHGGRVIGGCCGTDPSFIIALRAALAHPCPTVAALPHSD